MSTTTKTQTEELHDLVLRAIEINPNIVAVHLAVRMNLAFGVAEDLPDNQFARGRSTELRSIEERLRRLVEEGS